MYEIERKFIVDTKKWTPKTTGTIMKQGYLSTDIERTVRVRIAANNAFLTIKGKSEGIKRIEMEYEIPVTDAEILLKLCKFTPVVKTRYKEIVDGMIWEIDVFEKESKGLVLAEIELKTESQKFKLPEWIKEEVSGDHRYFNSWLTQHPFTEW